MNSVGKKVIYALIAAFFWLLIWELLSVAVGSKWLLPSPYETVLALGRLSAAANFWKSIGVSAFRMAAGFILAAVIGVLLAVISYFCLPVRIVLSPGFRMIKAVPVASFVVLLLLWVRAKNLPTAISFLMVLPLMYVNILQGLDAADKKLLEMAKVFRMSGANKVKYIYIPAVKPYFVSACNVGLGFCWKSGVAAEVIALVPDSIGRNVYDAKLYLLTDELFAWTIVIVIVSLLFEKAVAALIGRLMR